MVWMIRHSLFTFTFSSPFIFSSKFPPTPHLLSPSLDYLIPAYLPLPVPHFSSPLFASPPSLTIPLRLPYLLLLQPIIRLAFPLPKSFPVSPYLCLSLSAVLPSLFMCFLSVVSSKNLNTLRKKRKGGWRYRVKPNAFHWHSFLSLKVWLVLWYRLVGEGVEWSGSYCRTKQRSTHFVVPIIAFYFPLHCLLASRAFPCWCFHGMLLSSDVCAE